MFVLRWLLLWEIPRVEEGGVDIENDIPLFFSELIKREQELTDKIDEESIKAWVSLRYQDPRKRKVASLSSRGHTLREIKAWFKDREIPFTTSKISEIRTRARINGEW